MSTEFGLTRWADLLAAAAACRPDAADALGNSETLLLLTPYIVGAEH